MMIGRHPLSLCVGYKTPSAALKMYSASHGDYYWWGVIVGKFFIGIMRSSR